MNKLSNTYKKLGIDFTFPIEIKNAKGNQTYFEDSFGYQWKREYNAKGRTTYYENSDGFWRKREYDAKGNDTYYEDSDGYWSKHEYDAKGNITYCETSNGYKEGTPTNQINTMNKIQAYVRASKFYLTEELPLDFFELDEQEVTDFIRDNRWQPFEDWEPHDIWELIEDLAIDMLKIQLATVATLKEPETCEFCDSPDVFHCGLCEGCNADQYSDGARW